MGGRVFPLQGIPLTTVLPNGLLPTHWAFLFQKSPNNPSWESSLCSICTIRGQSPGFPNKHPIRNPKV